MIVPPVPPGFEDDVWLVAGQSNANKRERVTLPEHIVAIGNASSGGKYPDKWTLDQGARLDWFREGHVSVLGRAFAETVHAATGRRIALVHAACPGTPIQKLYNAHGQGEPKQEVLGERLGHISGTRRKNALGIVGLAVRRGVQASLNVTAVIGSCVIRTERVAVSVAR